MRTARGCKAKENQNKQCGAPKQAFRIPEALLRRADSSFHGKLFAFMHAYIHKVAYIPKVARIPVTQVFGAFLWAGPSFFLKQTCSPKAIYFGALATGV